MDVLEIVIQRGTGDGWPVIAEYKRSGEFLPTRREGTLRLDEAAQAELRQTQLNPFAYGSVLGKALFREKIRDAFMQARAQSPGHLRVLLVVEEPELRPLHWESLCGPIGVSGRWQHLALDQRALFSLYLPSLTERRFPAIGRRDLRALVVVANPPKGNPYESAGIVHFDGPATVASVRKALGEIPHDVLADVEGADGKPTLNELCARITAQHYTLLHIVAHGWHRARDGETILYLLDDDLQVSPAPATRLIERLDTLQGARGLPHLTFLSTCESAAPEAEREGALGGLAQRLVRELGMPAVVAMTKRVSIDTATALAGRFYERLRDHGEVARALVEAGVTLADAGDITVPALYERLGGRPLFSDTLDRELTDNEIEDGLVALQQLLVERAPILQTPLAEQAGVLRGMLGADRVALSAEARQEWDQALDEVNAICEETLDLNFRALALGQKPPAYDDRRPFPGLAAFQPDEEQFFFGREALVATLLERLQAQPFLALLGPSGSGKSSVVLAGLVPALREAQPELQMAYVTPGGNPVNQLSVELDNLQPDRPALVFVDQFEELFTMVEDEEQREAFLEGLLALPQHMHVILTMRADFWGECAVYPALKTMMQAHQELIGPMDTAELRSAMEQQAASVGLRFEADLSNTILDAVKEEPGAMPLLQHSLLEMWNRRYGRWLRTSEYRAIGGVQRAIAETADRIYEQVSDSEQTHMRDVFVRLTRLGEDGVGEDYRDTRRRVEFNELIPAGGDPTVTRRLVQRLADARLVVTGVNQCTEQEEVEVAHEALIRYWPRLGAWLEEDRDLLRLREGIRQAAREWQDSPTEEREHMLIHRGSRLEEIEAFMRAGRLALNEQEQAYVAACIDQREAIKRREEEQRQRELEQARRLAEEAQAREQAQAQARQEAEARAQEQAQAAASLRKRAVLIAGVGLVAVVLAIAAIFLGAQASRNEKRAAENAKTAQAASTRAIEQQQTAVAAASTADAERVRAEKNEQEARSQARLALSRQLAAESLGQFNRASYDLALLLAIESAKADQTPAARTALHRAMTAPVEALRIFTHDGLANQVSWSPDERRVLTVFGSGPARVWDVASGEQLFTAEGFAEQASWNGDGSRILTVGGDEVVLWDADSGAWLYTLTHGDWVQQASWSQDGSRVLTASSDGTARVWNASNGEEQVSLPHGSAVTQASWNGDGSRILTASDDGAAHVWDTDSGEELFSPLLHEGELYQASWIEDDSLILTASGEGVHFWDAETGLEFIRLPVPSKQASLHSERGSILTIDGFEVLVWDFVTVENEAQQHFEALSDEDSADFTVFEWDIESSPPVRTLTHQDSVNAASWSKDGQLILTASNDGTARVWDAGIGEELYTLTHGDWVRQASWSWDGSRVLTASDDGTARIWEFSAGVELLALPDLDPDLVSWIGEGSDVFTIACSELDEFGTCAGVSAQVWNVADGAQVSSIPIGLQRVEQASLSRDGSRVFVVGCDELDEIGDCVQATARIWDVTTGVELFSTSVESSLMQASWSGDGSHILIVGCEERDAFGDCVQAMSRVWEVAAGTELFSPSFESGLMQASWSGDGSRLLTVGCEELDAFGDCDQVTTRMWNVATGTELFIPSFEFGLIQASWNGDGSRILTVGCEELDEFGDCDRATARIWDVAAGAQVSSHPLGDVAGENVTWNADGTGVLIGARAYDLTSGTVFTVTHQGGVLDIGWNEAGTSLLSAGWDGKARVWDAATGKIQHTLSHELVVNRAGWNSDESRILTSSNDKTARVWDADTGELLFVLPHSVGVIDASWSPDESFILTLDQDGTGTLFYTHLDDLLAAACGRVLRNMTQEDWRRFMGDEPYRATCSNLEAGEARPISPPAAEPASGADASQPTDTPIPTPVAPTPKPTGTPAPPLALVPFEDPGGVFSLSHPSNVDQIEEDTTAGFDYGYSFSGDSGGILVGFSVLDAPVSDDEWPAFAEEAIADIAAESGLDEDVAELDRQVGEPGEHVMLVEFESAEMDAHWLIQLQESDGVLAQIFSVTPADLWSVMQPALAESLASFTWSPEALKAQVLTEPADEPTSTPTPTLQPTLIATPTPPLTLTPTSTPTAGVPQPSPTPSAACEGGPLTLTNLYSDAGSESCVEGGGWQVNVHFFVTGGNCVYTYYWQDEPIYGPTTEADISLPVFSAGGPLVGSAGVESGGEAVTDDLFVPAPQCP